MITGKESIEELIEKHPEFVKFLLKKNVSCIECGEPVWGTLEELLLGKGVEDIPAFIKELNAELGLEEWDEVCRKEDAGKGTPGTQ